MVTLTANDQLLIKRKDGTGDYIAVEDAVGQGAGLSAGFTVNGELELGAAGYIISGADGDYSGTDSFQPFQADLSCAATAGSADAGDPSFLAGVMGNVLGDGMSKAANYLAGVIGAFNATGSNATTYPNAAVLGIVGDTVSDCDAAFQAVIDGDSGVTTARAAFGVKSNNSVANSGFSYGLDLYSAAHDGYNALAILTADIRGNNQAVIKNPAAKTWVMDAPSAAVADGSLSANQITFYLDEGGNTLTVKVKYAAGTVKTGTIALT